MVARVLAVGEMHSQRACFGSAVPSFKSGPVQQSCASNALQARPRSSLLKDEADPLNALTDQSASAMKTLLEVAGK